MTETRAELPGAKIARLRRERWQKRCDEANTKIAQLQADNPDDLCAHALAVKLAVLEESP